MRISKSTKTSVKASKCASVTLSDGQVISNSSDAKQWLHYKKEQDTADYGTAMWDSDSKSDLAKLIKCFGEPNTWGSIESCNSSTSTDRALQHIKAAIDILGKSGKKDAITKDSIANLGVVYLDLNSEK